MTMNIKQKYEKKIPELFKELGDKNVYAAPKILKVVLNVGVNVSYDDKRREEILRHLSLITGQKPSARTAKKSIASFKVREGMTVGYTVTLRGKRMYDFLNKLLAVTLPRIRDFRGLNRSSIDKNGNLTIGIREHIVFPELSDEDIKEIKGLEITVATNAGSKERGETLLEALGFPFSEDEGEKRA